MTSTPGAGASGQAPQSWPVTVNPTHGIRLKGVPNFGNLNRCIWRSGQPSREGYLRLKQEGLKTVVNLREEFPQDKDLVPPGVHYVYIPIKDEHAPTEAQATEFLDIARNPSNWPVLVHCEGGQGRAGLMCALVRHSMDGWPHSKVMKEVYNYRTRYLGFIQVPMALSQRRFIEHWDHTNPAG